MARGKKVFDIEWKKEGRKIKIPVRVFKEDPSYINDHKERIIFRAEYMDADLSVEHTDANEIRKMVIEKLDTWYSVTWELFMLLKVHGGECGRDTEEEGFEVEVDVEFIAVGTTVDGKTVHMRVPKPNKLPTEPGAVWDGTRYCDSPTEGLPYVGTRRPEHRWRGPRKPETYSLVPATKANYTAFQGFKQALQMLLNKMHEHFHPDKIGALLFSPGLILPAPKPKKKKSKKMPKPKKKKRRVHA